jgi:D-galactarolactone cycloisomerase
MKIKSVHTHVLRHRLEEHFQSAFSTFTDRWACLVEIVCDDGTVGWGECLGPSGANAAVVEAMAPLIIGRDPLEIEPIWLELYNQFRDQGQRGLTMTAQSGIDIALWDIAGKHFGVPVHVLLGGAFRKVIPAYATGGFRPVGRDRRAALEEEAAGYIAEGFRATKIKIGFGVEEDAEVIAAVRAAIGPEARLMIDANHGYDAIEAVALGNRVADLDIDWFEEPVTPELLDAYCDVKAGQPLPVAAGETWHGRWAFAEAIQRRAVDILQPDVCGCGGFTEMKKIISMAEVAGLRLVPHVWGTAVQIAASLQVHAILPPGPPRHARYQPQLEFDRTCNPYRQAIITRPIEHEAGDVAVPEGPGLGIEINRMALEKYRV